MSPKQRTQEVDLAPVMISMRQPLVGEQTLRSVNTTKLPTLIMFPFSDVRLSVTRSVHSFPPVEYNETGGKLHIFSLHSIYLHYLVLISYTDRVCPLTPLTCTPRPAISLQYLSTC